jgi:hypothetical protein
MHRPDSRTYSLDRRGFFGSVAGGIQAGALAYLLSNDLFDGNDLLAAESPHADEPQRKMFDLKPRKSHFPGKAKAVIQLFQNGGPSQVDLFDPKPMLDKHHGEPYYDKIAADVSSPDDAGGLLRSPFKFAQHGKSGMWISDALPHLTKHADDIAVIRSMYNTHPNHEPALFAIHSGKLLPGRPAIGAWVTYGLGSENQNLPAYVVLDDPLGLPVNGVQSWQAGFLPPVYQGTRIRSTGTPVLDLHSAVEQPSGVVQLERDLLGRLDAIHKQLHPGQLRLDARIASYELAARMQLAATDALDVKQESADTLEMYGVGKEPTDSYARRCIMARRLVERGVRYVQIFINGQIWDNHNGLEKGLKGACDRTDQPVAALLKDLKQRGLFDEVLVVWGGEFGRLPIAQIPKGKDISAAGRDHGPRGFSLWMAGAGIKGGTVHGGTDEVGYAAVDKPVSIADWHATILHTLGVDYERLFYVRNGLKEKLTDLTKAKIVREILS